MSRYSAFVLPDVELTHPRAKDYEFASIFDFPEKDIKLPKWSCVLNCRSKWPTVFFTGAEINFEEDMNLTFIRFHHCKILSSCYSQNQMFIDHGKICHSCKNIENAEKGKVATRKSLVLKSCSILDFHSRYIIPAIEMLDFHLPHVYILRKKLFYR